MRAFADPTLRVRTWMLHTTALAGTDSNHCWDLMKTASVGALAINYNKESR